MTTLPNIRFAYMYRDANNYKQHGKAVFTNERLLPAEQFEKQIRACLHDGEYFIARQVHLEESFFDTPYDDDHPWHEFARVEATDDPILIRSLNTNGTSRNSWRIWRKQNAAAGMRCA